MLERIRINADCVDGDVCDYFIVTQWQWWDGKYSVCTTAENWSHTDDTQSGKIFDKKFSDKKDAEKFYNKLIKTISTSGLVEDVGKLYRRKNPAN